MICVVDASAAYRLLFGPSPLDNALARSGERLAPELLVAELLNARWKSLRTTGHAPRLDAVAGLLKSIRLEPLLPYADAACALAERLDHPVYDCFYVALAQHHGAVLLTADTKLARKLDTNGLGALVVRDA